jgi:hypothetical protein
MKRTPLKRKPLKRKRLIGKFKPLTPEIVENINQMREFFLSIWKKRAHLSEISGEKLPSPANSLYFHHILPKNSHKEAALDEDNIILLLPTEHGNVENNKFRYEEINKRRKILEKKYNL